MSEQKNYYIGFDVGTGSGRACLVDETGKLIADHSEPTLTHRSPTDHRIFEQSTTNIWASLSTCCKKILSVSGIDPKLVKGVGFDATCSLAVVDRKGTPISVSRAHPTIEVEGQEGKESDEYLGEEGDWNVILWADHRAEIEAEEINKSGEGVLEFVGGTMSLEMEIPKTLWLKKHMAPAKFEKCMLFDLPDYLTYRATGSLARSNCSLVCKCSYVPPGTKMTHVCDGTEETSSDGWSARFFNKIGLGDLVKDDFDQLGGIPGKNGLILTAGQPVGKGLSAAAAADLGLIEGTAVGSGVIDAYSGWIGTVAATASTTDGSVQESNPTLKDAERRLAACAGTSTCHITQSKEGHLVPGVWGPYHHAIFPGFWMNEGGQSSTGQLIDFTMTTHPAYPKLLDLAKKTGKNTFQLLGERLDEMQTERGATTLTHLTKHLHIYPDLHGNRSPLADPKMKGMITGLTLDDGLSDLAAKFNVTLEAIALQTRHIVDEMNDKGHVIDSIYMSGSQAKNGPLMRLLATVLQMPVIIPPQPSAAVVLGSAMLARYAHFLSSSAINTGEGEITTQKQSEDMGKQHGEKLWDIMVEMTKGAERVEPRSGELGVKEKKLLDVKYKIFRESVDVQKRWRELVDQVE